MYYIHFMLLYWPLKPKKFRHDRTTPKMRPCVFPFKTAFPRLHSGEKFSLLKSLNRAPISRLFSVSRSFLLAETLDIRAPKKSNSLYHVASTLHNTRWTEPLPHSSVVPRTLLVTVTMYCSLLGKRHLQSHKFSYIWKSACSTYKNISVGID